MSVLFHFGLAALIVLLSQLPSCRRDIRGDEGDSFHEVGIVTRPVPARETREENDPSEDAESESRDSNDLPEVEVVPEMPPVPLSLPEMAKLPDILGAGPPSSLPTIPTPDLVRPTNPTQGGEGPLGGAPAGGTSFLGIQDVGTRFVYVIDRSFSMENDNALQAAKLELLASLERLDETQQFQVIFYNNEVTPLEPRSREMLMFWGSDPQRLQVREQVRALGPGGGTAHLPALRKALSYNPDVVFLLTDGAADTALKPSELADIKRRNLSGARIHCIEFGRGEQSSLGTAGNFLRQLADQNHGKYTYRNVARR